MTPVLLVEIVSALVALVALIYLVVHLVRTRAGRRGERSGGTAHVRVSVVLCVAAVVHGVAAMAYGSGAHPAAYALGWAAVAAFLASGACMLAPVRPRLARPLAWHVALFVIGLVLVVAHAIAGRL